MELLNQAREVSLMELLNQARETLRADLPNGEQTRSIDLLCKTFQQSIDSAWQIRTLYLHPIEIVRGCAKFKGIITKLTKAGLFDLRDFLRHLLRQYPNSIVPADSTFYFNFSALVLLEIGKRKVTLVPTPKDKQWKINSIILPSLVYADKYYWLIHGSPMRTIWNEIYGIPTSFRLDTLLEGCSKEKIS